MPKIKIKPASNGQYYWVFAADNGEVLCTSETYKAKASARASAAVLKRTAATASIVDMA